MFCPECRKHCEAPVEEDLPPAKKRAPRELRCGDCGALLARDRLLAEFPSGEQPQEAGRELRQQPITVEDVLRETAHPNPIDSFRALQGRTQPPLRRHRGLFPWLSTQSEWNDSESPQIPRNFGRPRRLSRKAELILGIGSLAGIIVLLLFVSLREVSTLPHQTAGAQPQAAIVALAGESPVRAAGLDRSAASRLASQIGTWSRSGPFVIDERPAAAPVTAAAYTNGADEVEVLAQTQPTVRAAETMFHSLVARVRTRLGRGRAVVVNAVVNRFHGNPSALIDNNDATKQPTGAILIYGSPAQPLLPHRRVWLDGRTVYTIAAGSSAARDDFARQFVQ